MIAESLLKLIATPIAASRTAGLTAGIAVLSVCESLLSAHKGTLVGDIREIKASLKKRLDAETDTQRAEAKRKMAEATDTANKVNRLSHQDAMARLEREAREIENRKKAAEADEAEAGADQSKVKTARARMRLYRDFLKLQEDARKVKLDEKEQQLLDALLQLRSEGGMLYVDPPALQKLIDQQKAKE